MRLKDAAAAAFVTLLWSAGFVVGKIVFPEIPPLMAGCLRTAIVGALLMPLVRPPPGVMKYLVLYGVMMGGIHVGTLYWGLSGLDAPTAVITAQSNVFFGVIVAAVVFKDLPGVPRIVGLCLALAGLILVAGQPQVLASPFHFFLLLSSGLSFALASVILKQMPPVSALCMTAWMSPSAALFQFVMSLLFEPHGLTSLTTADPMRGWLGLLFMAFGASMVAQMIWVHLHKHLSVNQLMPFTLLEPIFTTIGAVLFLGDTLTLRFLMGAACIMCGIVCVALRRPGLVGRKKAAVL